MIGTHVSHYKIIEKLGEGGMGVVYKAQDTKLDRVVALKFLPHHLTVNEAEQARFTQEAKAAAALNHPNVCSIFRIDEFEGQQFIEMEYIDGVTLRRKISESALKYDDAVSFAIQIGEALQEAHTKGIVHRDVKAENIMVNMKNQIKVMDFGLAKLKGSMKLTRTSSTVGTLAYMAPEQVQGGEVDARSDIFSFGVVVFEMLTGRLPFRGEHEAAMVYSIVNEQAEAITSYLPDASVELIHIMTKALEKNPDDRYQSVSEMVVDLRRLKRDTSRVSRTIIPPTARSEEPPTKSTSPVSAQGRAVYLKKAIIGAIGLAVVIILAVLLWPSSSSDVAPSASKKMLVVIPFENLGSEDQEYFADGITEEITSRLSGLSGLGVIARSSARQYKKTSKTLRQIGEELGVTYVLQGTIRWGAAAADSGSRVRINPELVNVNDGTQIWSQPYEAVLSDVFKLQSEIATRVADAMGVALLQPERRTLEASLTENAEAYDFYLRGREYFSRSYDRNDWIIAEEMLGRALNLDPQFAAAHAQLSQFHVSMYWFFYDHKEERVLKAKSHAERALSLDPNLSDAHGSMGWYYYHGRLDYDNAMKEFEIALRLKPNNADIILGIASVRRRQGRMEEALANFIKSAEIDPRDATIHLNVGETYALLRRYTEAERTLNHTIALSPDWGMPYSQLAWTYICWRGDTSKARAVFEEVLKRKLTTKSPGILEHLVQIDIIAGRYGEALTLLSAGPEMFSQNQFRFTSRQLLMGDVYSLMGKGELARTSYDSARVVLEAEIRKNPDDARLPSAFGLALAGLGRKEEAIRAGKRGLEMLPVFKEAWRGSYRVYELAMIYAMAGEQNSAIDLLEQLLAMPSDFSVNRLRVEPVWKPLESSPRFQNLLAGSS